MQKLTYEVNGDKFIIELENNYDSFNDILEYLVIPVFAAATFDAGMVRRLMSEVDQTDEPSIEQEDACTEDTIFNFDGTKI